MAKKQKQVLSKFFGVKSLYLNTALKKKAKPSAYMIEERVVIVNAKTFAEAVKIAEKDAVAYSKYKYENSFGEMVTSEYLKCMDAFELAEEPGQLVEVFSATNVTKKKPLVKSVIDQRMGKIESKSEKALRKFFLQK